jgi:2-polyprenyl-6-methoxyphenol hydroxylase-like FAD-dependent oxidoreductase
MNDTVIIAGAGPVGLTLALLLHGQGKKVRVFEQVSDIRPLGVGINLLPHSVRVLHQLGLESALDKVAIRTSALHYYNKFGQKIWAEPRGLAAGYQYPQYSIHRGEFQLLLLRKVTERIGREAVLTNHALSGWQDTCSGIEATFYNRDSDREVTVPGACLIAADGINSTARTILYPNEGAPIYGGRILWRAVSRSAPFLDGRTMFMAGYQDCKFVAYPIKKHTDGTVLVNWIAELSVPDYQPDVQDWNKKVTVDAFSDWFQAWKFDWIDIPQLIASCDHVYEFPLSDRDPKPQWTFGNMTLIGDAAHPMYPIGSNGASQGILDAETLCRELCEIQSLHDALVNYEAERRPATAKIVLLNRQNGPEQVMQIAEERAPGGFEDINEVIPHHELEEIALRYKQTAGFTVEAVNRENPQAGAGD